MAVPVHSKMCSWLSLSLVMSEPWLFFVFSKVCNMAVHVAGGFGTLTHASVCVCVCVRACVCTRVFHQLSHLCLDSMKMADHRRSPQVMFYATGLGHEDTDTFDPYLDNYVKKKTAWKMRTLQSLLRQHNHTEVGMVLATRRPICRRQQRVMVSGCPSLLRQHTHTEQERCVGRNRELYL